MNKYNYVSYLLNFYKNVKILFETNIVYSYQIIMTYLKQKNSALNNLLF